MLLACIIIGGWILLGLCILVRARVRARKMQVLERGGKAVPTQVTEVRFKALNRRGRSTYGLISFSYEYEGKTYARRQAIEELSAQDLLRTNSTRPCALVLPKRPGTACLALNKDIPYDDPTIRRDTINSFFIMFFPSIPGGFILFGLISSGLGH